MRVSGGSVSPGVRMFQPWVAGEVSTMPSAVTARTEKKCQPTARPLYGCGEVHAAYGAESSEHSKVAVASVDEKLKLALVSEVSVAGASAIVVSGGRTTVQL